jgi:hypothetical protein
VFENSFVFNLDLVFSFNHMSAAMRFPSGPGPDSTLGKCQRADSLGQIRADLASSQSAGDQRCCNHNWEISANRLLSALRNCSGVYTSNR